MKPLASREYEHLTFRPTEVGLLLTLSWGSNGSMRVLAAMTDHNTANSGVNSKFC